METDEVEYGSIPTYDGEIPEKQPTDEYTYTFAWWEPTISEVKWNAVYVAKFDATKIEKQEIQDSSADNSQAWSEVDSSTSSQNDNNMSSWTEWNGSEGSYSSFGGWWWNTQDSSSDKPASELQSWDIESGSATDLLEETIEAQAETWEVAEYTDAYREAELTWIWNTLNEKEIEWRKASHHIIVDVSAPVWAFPEWTELKITPIENQKIAQELKDQLVENTDVTEESQLVSFDISFIYKLSNWEEIKIQPKEWKTVKVSFNYEYNDSFSDADNNDNKELKVYHFEEQIDNEWNKTEEIEIKEIKINESESLDGELVIDAENFSIYSVAAIDTPMLKAVQPNQLSNFSYWVITFKSSNNSTCVSLMDRNLWATSTWAWTNASASSYWYYYQWWNNYWFTAQSAADNYITDTVDVSWVNPSEYSSSDFVAKNSWAIWTQSKVQDLRWWWNDNNNNQWWQNQSNYINRQWPCPSGWHVPSAYEMWLVVQYRWQSHGYTVTSSSNFYYVNLVNKNKNRDIYDNFYSDLQIPYAGYITRFWRTASNYAFWSSTAPYYSSSEYNWYLYQVRLANNFAIWLTTSYRQRIWYAYPVRCFYNSLSCDDIPEPGIWDSNPCDLPWWWTAEDGASVTWYTTSSATCPNTCTSATATCNNGEWSVQNFTWTYTQQTCTTNPSTCDTSFTLNSTGANWTYSGCTSYTVNANSCNAWTTKYKLTNCANGYHTENNSTCVSNSKQVACAQNGKPANSSYVSWNVQITWQWTWNSGNWSATGSCAWICDPHYHTWANNNSCEIDTFQITWKDGNRNTLKTDTVNYNETPVYAWATPTKTATAQYSYTFNNTWSPAIVPATADATYTAQFNSVVNEYTITWNYRDANWVQIQSTGNIAYGQTPNAPSLPATSQSQSTVYTFTSWSPTVHSVTGAETYTAQYNESPRQYTITWKNDDWTTIDTTTVNYGATPTHADATKANTAQYTYTFAWWTPAIANVTWDATYTAQFNSVVNNYVVTIVSSNINSWTVSTWSVTVPYGTSISANSNPLTIWSTTVTAIPNEQTEQYTHTFKDWTNTCGNEVSTGCTITANFTSTLRSYTITWKNENGTTLETDSNVPYGTTPTYDSATPQKAATEEFTYTFDTWSPAVHSVTGDTTYTATYTNTVNVYTASITAVPAWYGTVNKSSVPANYGTPISTSNNTLTIWSTTVTATPTASDAQYTYTFTGWTFNNCGSEWSHQIRSGCTITANFGRTVNTYTITWKNDDNSVIKTDTWVAYGTIPEYRGSTPQKTGGLIYSYVFSGWTPAISEVHWNQTYTATYTQTLRRYTVTWRNTDGAILRTDEDVWYGATPEYHGATPTNGASNQYVTSTFAWWNPAISTVEKDVEYFARYTYTITSGMVHDTSKDSVSVTLNANWWQFSNNSGYDVLNYDYYNRAEKKYAHSANYSDDWTRSTTASSSDAKQYPITITWAEYLYVNVTYDLHEILLWWVNNNKDKLDIYAWKTTSATGVAHFSWNTNDWIQSGGNYTITGDSVLFDFYLATRNISSMESNWFYAVIVWVIPVGYITDDEVQTPSRQWYTFDGWYTAAEWWDEVNLTGLVVSGNMEIYAHWTPNNVQYVVYHYVKRVWQNTYELPDTQTWYAATDSILTLSWLSSTFPCAHYDRWSLTWTESGPWAIATQTTVAWDGSTKIYLYYVRDMYNVTLVKDEHTASVSGSGRWECGSEVPVDATPDPWYHFVRWDKEERGRREVEEDPESPEI